jgi:hypothetical protein
MRLGQLFSWIERRLKDPLPSFIGWELLGLSLVGLVFMPLSGFWLVLALAIYTILVARRRGRTASATV